MECFTDLVGVRGLCEEVTPKSQIYLDDVGVSKSDLEAFSTKQYASVEDYFQKRSEFAYKAIATEVYNHFRNKYLALSLVDSHRLGYYKSDLTTYTGANYRGINMDFLQNESFFSFTISEVNLLLNYTGNVTLVIYDLLEEKLLFSEVVPCTAGKISTVYIHKQFLSDKRCKNIFVGYDSDGITSFASTVKENLCCGNITCSNSYMNAKGGEIDGGFNENNITNLNHTAGVSLVYSIECDHESWICSHGRSLAIPAAYKIAEIVVSDALFNTSGERATNDKTINIDELQNRFNFFRSKYNETIGNILSNMVLPKNKCFICNTTHRTVIKLP